MRTILFNSLVVLFLISCTNNDSIDLTIYNPDLSIIQNLDNGVLPLDIVAELGAASLHGLQYAGGYIFHVDETDGSVLIATDYSEAGITAWGDIFDLDTNSIIGSGLTNTELIVAGNANDNSINGVEHDGDYAFKTVLDLEYNNFDDWFIPTPAAAPTCPGVTPPLS